MKKAPSILMITSPMLFAAMLYLVLQITDPATAGPGGVFLVFVLIYMECLSVLFVLLHFGLRWATRLLKKMGSGNSPVLKIGARKAYYVASIISFAPVILLAMHSFSKIRLTDIGLLFLFMTIATFYVLRRP